MHNLNTIRPHGGTVALYPCDDDGTLAKPPWATDGAGLRDISGNGYTANAPAGVLFRQNSPFYGALKNVGVVRALDIRGGASGTAASIISAICAGTGGVEFYIRFERPYQFIGTAGQQAYSFFEIHGNGGELVNKIDLRRLYSGGAPQLRLSIEHNDAGVQTASYAIAAGGADRLWNQVADFHHFHLHWDQTSGTYWLRVNGELVITKIMLGGLDAAGHAGSRIFLGASSFDSQFSLAGVHFYSGPPRLGPRRPLPATWRPTLHQLRDGTETAYADFRNEGTAYTLHDISDASAISTDEDIFHIHGYLPIAGGLTAGNGQIKYTCASGVKTLAFKQPGSSVFGTVMLQPDATPIADLAGYVGAVVVLSDELNAVVVRVTGDDLPDGDTVTTITAVVAHGAIGFREEVGDVDFNFQHAMRIQDGGCHLPADDHPMYGLRINNFGLWTGDDGSLHWLGRIRTLPPAGKYAVLLGSKGLTTERRVHLLVDDAGSLLLKVTHQSTDAIDISSTSPVFSDGETTIHHIVATVDGSGGGLYKLYVDNTLVKSHNDGANRGPIDSAAAGIGITGLYDEEGVGGMDVMEVLAMPGVWAPTTGPTVV